jgi:hypothetical protein
MHRTITAAAATFVLVITPALGFAAPTMEDSNGIPVADGEQAARTCYVHAMHFWNNVMEKTPRSHKWLDWSYRGFAGCARVAISTAKVLPNGERLPWFIDYFADTVGATYAQLQLAAITTKKEHCSHLSMAHDLAQQALETESSVATPSIAQPQHDWQSLTDSIKAQTLSCSAKGVS